MVNAEQLISYVRRYTGKAEKKGQGAKYPTLRQTALRFNASLEEVEAICQHMSGYGRLKLIQLQSGIIQCKGDWLVEART